MGKSVIAVLKVLPDDVDTDLDELAEKIGGVLPEGCVVTKKEVQPIAFGLSALKLQVRLPADHEGGTTPVEEAIEALEEVQRVETEVVTLI